MPETAISALEAESIVAQGAHADPTKPLGLASTNVAHSILGGTGFCDATYNWSVDGPVAQFGPSRTNQTAVIAYR